MSLPQNLTLKDPATIYAAVVATYGALMATMVAIWNIYTWKRTRPRLEVSPVLVAIPHDGPAYIGVGIVSINGPTSLQFVELRHYRNWILYKLNRPQAVIFHNTSEPDHGDPEARAQLVRIDDAGAYHTRFDLDTDSLTLESVMSGITVVSAKDVRHRKPISAMVKVPRNIRRIREHDRTLRTTTTGTGQ